METNLKNIEPSGVEEMLNNNDDAVMIDVRTPQEYNYGHVPCSINVPLGTFTAESIKNQLSVSESTPLLLICQSGARSTSAGHQLLDAGFKNIINVSGGMLNWSYSGLPMAA